MEHGGHGSTIGEEGKLLQSPPFGNFHNEVPQTFFGNSMRCYPKLCFSRAQKVASSMQL
jgi:hypothetical protein